MKKTLMKTLFIAAFLFCSSASSAFANEFTAKPVGFKAHKIVCKTTSSNNVQANQYRHLRSSQNGEGLKTYHVGAIFFDPSYQVPTAADLISSLHSHPFFIGEFESVLSHSECLNKMAKANSQFVMFKTAENDFYMGHANGVRHFSINRSHEKWNMASVDNTFFTDYRNLDAFVECTLVNKLA